MWSFSIVESRRSAIRCRILSPSVFSSSSVNLHWRQPEWHLHLASQADPLAQRMGAEMAMALADPIRVGSLRRLKICAARDCTAAVMDLSRNQSRIFCDTGNCGNRLHVAA